MVSIAGSCLCGAISFECEDRFNEFHFCRCTQCQKMTGSAHAANLFTDPDNIIWKSGEDMIARYDIPGRTMTSCFCTTCGSPVPFVSTSGKSLVVPAGSLNKTPETTPQDNIFWCERASWYDEGLKSVKYNGFPDC